MNIKMAVFDMAGTTVADDNFVAKAFQEAFRKNKVEITIEDVNPLMGYHKPLAIQIVLERAGVDFDEQLIDQVHTDFENEMIDFYEYSSEVKPLPGTEEAFQYLKEKGVYIALNTGFSKDIADTIMTRFQWKEKGLVDDYIASDEVEEGRPASYMIHELMTRAGVDDASLVAKIGDTAVDIQEGQHAGCGYVVGITTGAYLQTDLEKYKPTHIIHHLSELPAILQ
ncbi:MAG TPA: HAD hydrolase-like protein [Chitinophagaceae bacterium]